MAPISPQKVPKTILSSIYLKRCSEESLAYFLGDWSQYEKCSEFKPTLVFVDCNFWIDCEKRNTSKSVRDRHIDDKQPRRWQSKNYPINQKNNKKKLYCCKANIVIARRKWIRSWLRAGKSKGQKTAKGTYDQDNML